MEVMRNAQKSLFGKSDRESHVGNLSVDGRIDILKMKFEVFMGVKILSSGRFFSLGG
jgi:hypothetical protein